MGGDLDKKWHKACEFHWDGGDGIFERHVLCVPCGLYRQGEEKDFWTEEAQTMTSTDR